jgi:CRISPR-associated protein Csb2
MPTLLLRFPGGSYHATPAGHHVNEGVVEWPPSPWRLLRTLLASGFTTQHWREVPPVARRLIESLAAVLPEYRLPPAALGHSRHYMPTAVREKGREKTTLVFDTFADVADGALWVRWPTVLDDEAFALFRQLATHLGYLGRSESWVDAQVVSDHDELPSAGRAFPHGDGHRPGRGFEQVALMAPEAPTMYAAWRSQEVEAALDAAREGGAKKPSKATLAKVEQQFPADLLTCLQLDTAWWRERKWSQAPGSRRVIYWREATALAVGPPAAAQRPEPPRVQAMLFALTSPSGSRSALPSVTRTLPQAELLHRALIARLGDEGHRCPELSGRDEHGNPLRGHKHTHIMPVDLDEDGHLDHILVYAPQEFGAVAQYAARSVKRTYAKGGVGELQVALAGQGSLDDLRAMPGKLGRAIERVWGPCREWRSATPFVVPRYLKTRGTNTLEGQVQAELAGRGFPRATVEILPWDADTKPLRHYVRRRRGTAPQPVLDAAFAMRLRFNESVRGPICLGYGSHFGLGRFNGWD